MEKEMLRSLYNNRQIERTEHPHIVKVAGVASGEPIVFGTSIMVRTIVEAYRSSNSVEEILWDFPRLSSAQVHDALSYYHDHQREMDILLEQATPAYWQPILTKMAQKHAQTLP